MARDSYSYLHFPMIAGIVLVALGVKKTLGDVDDPLKTVSAFALLGGLAAYLLAHVSFRYRHIQTINTRRALLAVILVAFLPVATEIPALATVAVVTVAVWLLIIIETRRYGQARERVRHGDFGPEAT
jgi:low temperature requirement protein LtrA